MTRNYDGPGEDDVFTMLAMVQRDLDLAVRIIQTPLVGPAPDGWKMSMVIEPRRPPVSPWERWMPIVIESEWRPRTGRTWAAHVWHQLFLSYSYDFPDSWPKESLVQAPLWGPAAE